MSGEFSFIRSHLAPLSAGFPGALNLTDDAAILPGPSGLDYVIASDMLVEGVHFHADTPPEIIAARALGTNLSDLAAMGAEPVAWLSSLALSEACDTAWQGAFASACQDIQHRHGLHLIGGDTTRTPGPLTVSLTLIGQVPRGTAITRSGGQAGDEVWVSGELGEGVLGRIAYETYGVGSAPNRFTHPTARLSLGQALRGIATALIDISDGLVADLDHLARASGVALDIGAELVPLSETGRSEAGEPDTTPWRRLVCGGDDYELAFLAPLDHREAIMAISAALDVRLTPIGQARTGQSVHVHNAAGHLIKFETTGFTHF